MKKKKTAHKKVSKRKATSRLKIKSALHDIIQRISDIDDSKDLQDCRTAIGKLTDERDDLLRQARNREDIITELRSRINRVAGERNDQARKNRELLSQIDRYKYLDEFIQVLQNVKAPLLERPEVK